MIGKLVSPTRSPASAPPPPGALRKLLGLGHDQRPEHISGCEAPPRRSTQHKPSRHPDSPTEPVELRSAHTIPMRSNASSPHTPGLCDSSPTAATRLGRAEWAGERQISADTLVLPTGVASGGELRRRYGVTRTESGELAHGDTRADHQPR